MTVKHQRDYRHEEEIGAHVAYTGETSNLHTISIGKSERKRKELNCLGANMKIILRRNLEKYDGSVTVDYSQFYVVQRQMVISLASGNDKGLH